MTRDDTRNLVMAIYNSFPNWKPDDLTMTVNAWHFIMEEYDFKEMLIAFKTYLKSNTSGFAPSVSQLIQLLPQTIQNEESQLNENEAWCLVRKAISRASYYADEEYLKLPKTVQKAVGSPSNLRQIAISDSYNEEVESSNFKRAYRTVVARNNEVNRMPKEVQNLIESVSQLKQEQYGLGVTTTPTPAQIETKNTQDLEPSVMPLKAQQLLNELRGKE